MPIGERGHRAGAVVLERAYEAHQGFDERVAGRRCGHAALAEHVDACDGGARHGRDRTREAEHLGAADIDTDQHRRNSNRCHYCVNAAPDGLKKPVPVTTIACGDRLSATQSATSASLVR